MLTYMKQKARWFYDAAVWPYYSRMIGCAVDFDKDGEGYLIGSDGSKTFVSDLDSARILLFARSLAMEKGKLPLFDKIRVKLAKIILGV